MVWGACAQQPKTPVHTPDTQTSNSTPTAQSSGGTLELEQMDIEIPEDLPDLNDVPEEPLSDFDSWAHSVLEYQW